MTDRFAGISVDKMNGPITDGFDVTPSDSTDLAEVSRVLWIGTGGDLSLLLTSGNTVTLKNVPDGHALFAKAVRVLATATTATDIVALL